MGTRIVVVNVTTQNKRLQIVVNNQVVHSTDAESETVDKLLACQQVAVIICAALKAVDVEAVLTPHAVPLYILD